MKIHIHILREAENVDLLYKIQRLKGHAHLKQSTKCPAAGTCERNDRTAESAHS